MTIRQARDPEKDLLTIEQVSTMLGVSVATLRWWKHVGKGPKSIKIGRRIRYWRQDVLDWLEEQERLSELPALPAAQLNSRG